LGFSGRTKKTWLGEEEVDNKVGGWRARDRETSSFKDKRRRIEAELARKGWSARDKRESISQHTEDRLLPLMNSNFYWVNSNSTCCGVFCACYSRFLCATVFPACSLVCWLSGAQHDVLQRRQRDVWAERYLFYRARWLIIYCRVRWLIIYWLTCMLCVVSAAAVVGRRPERAARALSANAVSAIRELERKWTASAGVGSGW
jgi:hypothetical protein